MNKDPNHDPDARCTKCDGALGWHGDVRVPGVHMHGWCKAAYEPGGSAQENDARRATWVGPTKHESPREFFSCSDHLRLVDAVRLTLLASWREDGSCDSAVVSAAIKTLEALEKRLVAGR